MPTAAWLVLTGSDTDSRRTSAGGDAGPGGIQWAPWHLRASGPGGDMPVAAHTECQWHAQRLITLCRAIINIIIIR